MNTKKITKIITGGVFMVGNCTARLQETANLEAADLQEIVEVAVNRIQ
ncbi:MAG: hypothetical protein LBR92_00490 [Puniceicoccales bacterium]|jgi:hypothetical protein|nr:hypothetical protein [Puniceicoccales bacterium]